MVEFPNQKGDFFLADFVRFVHSPFAAAGGYAAASDNVQQADPFLFSVPSFVSFAAAADESVPHGGS